ncbi:hypothetical protein WJX72_010053 [[Myrmecia] bisecta]|uniref:Mitochondrial carrier protein n=1 Tax=[Myrmecia] bisecta TaxID=41462 RepID=A0AAW1P4U2_9CHLO
MRQRGLRSLCAGSLTAAATAAPISALFAVTYEATKARLAPRLPKDRQWVAQCLAGASASVATSFVYTPSECIKAQLQVGQYRCAVRAGLDLVRQHGVQRLYHGWTAVLCRNVPQSMAKFLVYEQLRMRVCRTVNKEEMSPGATMLCGSIAGSAAACLTTPFDVVKTRMQLHGTASLAGSTSAASMHSTASVASTMRSIVRQEGLQGLYCGLAPRLLIYMTQGAIYFCAYELLRKALHTEAEQWRQGHRLGLQAMHTDMGQWQQGHAPPYSTKLHGTG